MSDENAPKLRLKPKLGTDTAAAPQATPEAVAPPPSEAVPPVAAEANPGPRLGRLRPKLAPAAESAATPAATPAAEPAPEVAAAAVEPARPKPRLSNPPMDKPMTAPPMMMTSSASAPAEPAAEPAKPAAKFGLKPKSGPSEEAAVPPAAVEGSAGGEPAADNAGVRKVTGAPFPPPGKFPPPAGLKKALATAKAESSRPAVAKTAESKSGKKLIFLVGGLVALGVVLGGGFFAYQKFFQPPPAPPQKIQPVAKPAPVAPHDAAASATTPASTEASAAVPAPKPDEAAVVAEAKPTEDAKPVGPPPPPPPTVAFRGWVENLQIRGMRGGANPRVFIGNTSYGRGDLVNPKLNITFEGVNEATRTLIFKDKTGATVERRQ